MLIIALYVAVIISGPSYTHYRIQLLTATASSSSVGQFVAPLPIYSRLINNGSLIESSHSIVSRHHSDFHWQPPDFDCI